MPITWPLLFIIGLVLFGVWLFSAVLLIIGILKKSKILKVLSLIAFTPLTILFLFGVLEAVKDQLPIKASAADLSGTWQYVVEYEKTSVTLVLKADGTFTQTVAPASIPMVHHEGHWLLNGPWIEFDGLLMKDGTNWGVAKSIDYQIYRCDLLGSDFGIRGGEFDDTDGWGDLKRIK